VSVERRRIVLKGALLSQPGNLILLMELGNSYSIVQKDAVEAARWFQAAVAAHPLNALAHHNLGSALHDKQDLDGAIGASKEALRLNPNDASAHNTLGIALQAKGDLEGAIAAFKAALRMEPKQRSALTNLSRAERMQQLLLRLPDVLAGRAEPNTPVEACEFAFLCAQPFQKRYVAAVRLSEKAFVADSKLAEALSAGHRYNAACYATLAAAGKDAEMTIFGVEEWGHLTDRGHAWLRADLTAWADRTKDPKNGTEIRQKLIHWRQDADLIAVRDSAWLAAMPGADRKRWEAIWADVDALLADANKPSPQPPSSDK
jgi:tetratricopeptide (TPR) repeat protein